MEGLPRALIHGVMMLAPAGSAGEVARGFMASKLRGYECVDAEWAPDDRNLSAFAKSLLKPAAVAAAAVDDDDWMKSLLKPVGID